MLIADCLGELLLRIVGAVLLWVTLLPVAIVVSTPIVLAHAAFRPGSYWANVADGYDWVITWWQQALDHLILA